ncbi:rhomboid family intramembrane serine protease [Glycomyces algeriensis]|uniref:Rhomboid family intramembrane serine protease n=1 Tax=Glycomyces algeriensis TaxID=256037 RepID=A0A9W6LG22_9ACTN|nr:rhomboid family intramembrane serine protease [Glycomyces algeriensis]MDA1367083.1 rhomboid family intramembrane serine protease [Glycomyces algeriensis]MDR7348530.1 membrane associated rhomboid family serine protease [Glycomyces algeriensis]GLI41234.1 rhomboid family intramembrane serine protease [Glycomyces algeriensis]
MSDEQSAPTCYRHRNRQTYLRCVRCDKPICADCRIDAPVGFQCPDCVAAGRRTMRQTRNSFGGGARAGTTGTVTKVLIGANVVAFILTVLSAGVGAIVSPGATEMHLAFAEIGLGFSQFGAPVPEIPVSLFGVDFISPTVSAGGYYRMVTAMFLHFGIIHLLFNMVVLWMLGRVLERDLGPARYLTAYMLSGLAGSVAVYLFSFGTTTAGASGAVYGLFGLMIMVNRKLRRDNQGIYVLLGLNLVMTVMFQFSFAGHVGGLIGGLICGAILTFTPRKQRALHWVGFALFLVVLAAITFFQTGVLDNQYDIV